MWFFTRSSALNAWVTRLNARGETLESLRRRYDAALSAALDALAALLGAVLFLVNLAIDGLAMQGIVRAWVSAAPSEQTTALRIADALDRPIFGPYTFETLLLPGFRSFATASCSS
jgi:hypothetical protein